MKLPFAVVAFFSFAAIALPTFAQTATSDASQPAKQSLKEGDEAAMKQVGWDFLSALLDGDYDAAIELSDLPADEREAAGQLAESFAAAAEWRSAMTDEFGATATRLIDTQPMSVSDRPVTELLVQGTADIRDGALVLKIDNLRGGMTFARHGDGFRVTSFPMLKVIAPIQHTIIPVYTEVAKQIRAGEVAHPVEVQPALLEAYKPVVEDLQAAAEVSRNEMDALEERFPTEVTFKSIEMFENGRKLSEEEMEGTTVQIDGEQVYPTTRPTTRAADDAAEQ